MLRRLIVLTLFLTTPAAGLSASDDPTAATIDARRVSGAITVTPVATSTAKTIGAPYRYRAAGDSDWRALRDSQIFLASEPVNVNLYRANPLEVQISVRSKKVSNASFGQLSDFMKALLQFPKAIGAPQGAAFVAACGPLNDIFTHIDNLWSALRAGTTNGDALKAWRATFERNRGPEGVKQVITLIDQQEDYLKSAAKSAQTELDAINAYLGVAPARGNGPALQPGSQPITPAPGGGRGAALSPAVPPTPGAAPLPQPAPTTPPPSSTGAGSPPTPAPDAAACSPEEIMRRVAELAVIGSARDGVALLDAQAKALEGLKAMLKPYADSGLWDGENYLIYTSDQTVEDDASVTIEVATLNYVVTPDTISITPAENSSTITIMFRNYWTLIPEKGAGVIVSRVVEPQYGTTKNAAGQTVVGPPTLKELSFSGAFVLNAVCRCGMHSFAYPLLQLGVSTDTSNVGLMLGTGLRFVNPNRFVLSGGALVAWIRDLNQLSVGSPVNGNADINADLTRKVVVKPYVGILYKF